MFGIFSKIGSCSYGYRNGNTRQLPIDQLVPFTINVDVQYIYIGQDFHSSISWFSISNVNAGASLSKQKVKRQILFQLFMLLVKFHGEAGRSFHHFRD